MITYKTGKLKNSYLKIAKLNLILITVVATWLAATVAYAANAGPTGAADTDSINGFTPDHSVQEVKNENRLKSIMDHKNVDRHLKYLTKYPGEDATPGIIRRQKYIVKNLKKAGLGVNVQTFYPYLADSQKVKVQLDMVAPYHRSLRVKEKDQPWHKKFDKASVGFNEGTPPADLTREIVYANFGRPADYDYLASIGVDVSDKIVLVRFGGSQRSEVPYQAYAHGAAGVIFYSDPEQDGFTKGTVYPEGPWRAPAGIQRGTIYRWTLYSGDPLTPGYAATKDAPRIPVSKSNISQIPPTTPIGYGAAKPLLKNLGGPVAPQSWQGGLPFTYHIGPGPTKTHLKIGINYKQRPSSDIVARVRGSEYPDEMVILDAHYDTWDYGAYDNQAAVATALELARGFGELKRQGWQPKRSIVIIFTSAEERGITGSAEWTEWLGKEKMAKAVAEINNDVIAGSSFRLSGVPALNQLLFDVTKQVHWPETSGSAYDNWVKNSIQDTADNDQQPSVSVPGGGADFMIYRGHFGVPIASVGGSSPGGRYHCACDDYRSLKKFMDPDLKYSTAVGRVDGLLLMRLANADALPLNYGTYAKSIGEYLHDFEGSQRIKFGSVQLPVERDIAAAQEWAEAASKLEATREERLGNGERGYEEMNSALMQLERSLLVSQGLPGRAWYKHQIYAPQFHNGFALQILPGLYDSLETRQWRPEASQYEKSLHRSLRNAISITEQATR